jgi:hypothetical protein
MNQSGHFLFTLTRFPGRNSHTISRRSRQRSMMPRAAPEESVMPG